MSSKRGFGDSTINNKSPLVFGMAASQLDEKPKDPSSASQPLFPVTPFSATESSKPQAVRDVAFGRAFDVTAQGQEGSRTMDIKGKAVEKKAKSSPTADLTTLVIREIPEMFNKNTWVKRFYSRFGEVTKVTCNTARKSATVTFKTHVSMLYTNNNSYNNNKYYYMANPVLGKSLCSDWFLLGRDFAVRTVSMETVQSVYFCFGAKPANSKFATKTAKKKKKKNV